MKDRDESAARTVGMFNIAVTPFADDGSVDMPALEEGIDRLLEHGVDGFLIGGTYGEFATMTVDERAELFRGAMARVGDRVPVLLCAAHSDWRVVSELTRLASDLGGLPMVTAPYVSEVENSHIESFFRRIAPESATGIMIYNAPGIGITLSPDLICRLAEIEGVVALKQGDLSPTSVDVLAGRLKGRIRMLAASDLALLGPLALGFDGVSSTNSCALPEIILDTYRAMRSGDAERAGDLHRSWYPFRELAREFGQPQTTKAAMDMRGWSGGQVRPPLENLTREQLDRLSPVVDALVAAPANVAAQ